MGCGPSKDANVAAGNTVRSKSLLKKNSDKPNNTTSSSFLSSSSSSSTTTTTTATTNNNNNNAVADKADQEFKGGEDAEVKDVDVPSASVAPEVEVAEEEEGKFIAAGSPDRYFSSRKDEEAVQGVLTASTRYFSSPSEVEALDSVPLPVDGKEEEAEAEEKVSDGNGGEEIVPKQEEEGKSSIKDSADMKETILVEENERKL